MITVGVARLKAELSRYLDAAKHGQEVLITERGRSVGAAVLRALLDERWA